MKIVILDCCTVTNGDVSLEPIKRLGETVSTDLVPQSELVSVIGDADAVICNKANIDRKVIESCANLKYVGLFATGYNNIDIEAASEKGVLVANVPGYSTDAVAQHTFSMLLALAGSLYEYNNSTHAGDWIKSKTFSYFPFPMSEISGKTLGIFGYGSIGRAVATIGRAFNMNVIVHTRTAPKDTAAKSVSLKELFSASDYLTLHAPLNKDTERIVRKETLALMKKSAYLINTSRGGVIDEKDLADALNGGVIAGAGLDVMTVEPMLADNPLFNAKNCIITPHIAWAPIETRRRLIARVAENLEAFINGAPINIVNR